MLKKILFLIIILLFISPFLRFLFRIAFNPDNYLFTIGIFCTGGALLSDQFSIKSDLQTADRVQQTYLKRSQTLKYILFFVGVLLSMFQFWQSKEAIALSEKNHANERKRDSISINRLQSELKNLNKKNDQLTSTLNNTTTLLTAASLIDKTVRPFIRLVFTFKKPRTMSPFKFEMAKPFRPYDEFPKYDDYGLIIDYGALELMASFQNNYQNEIYAHLNMGDIVNDSVAIMNGAQVSNFMYKDNDSLYCLALVFRPKKRFNMGDLMNRLKDCLPKIRLTKTYPYLDSTRKAQQSETDFRQQGIGAYVDVPISNGTGAWFKIKLSEQKAPTSFTAKAEDAQGLLNYYSQYLWKAFNQGQIVYYDSYENYEGR